MSNVTLTDDQIVDLIFERQIMVEGVAVSSRSSCLSILAKLELRLNDGKSFKRKNPVFLRSASYKHYGTRAAVR